jgi:hypothetical protein
MINNKLAYLLLGSAALIPTLGFRRVTSTGLYVDLVASSTLYEASNDGIGINGPSVFLALATGDVIKSQNGNQLPFVYSDGTGEDYWKFFMHPGTEVNCLAYADQFELVAGKIYYVDPYEVPYYYNAVMFRKFGPPYGAPPMSKPLSLRLIPQGRKAIIKKGFATITPKGTEYFLEVVTLSNSTNTNKKYYKVTCHQGQVLLKSSNGSASFAVTASSPSQPCYAAIEGAPHVYCD